MLNLVFFTFKNVYSLSCQFEEVLHKTTVWLSKDSRERDFWHIEIFHTKLYASTVCSLSADDVISLKLENGILFIVNMRL